MELHQNESILIVRKDKPSFEWIVNPIYIALNELALLILPDVALQLNYTKGTKVHIIFGTSFSYINNDIFLFFRQEIIVHCL